MLSIKIVQISIMFQRNISKLVLFIMLIWNVISLYLAICIQMQSLLQSEEIFGPILPNSGFSQKSLCFIYFELCKKQQWSYLAVLCVVCVCCSHHHQQQPSKPAQAAVFVLVKCPDIEHINWPQVRVDIRHCDTQLKYLWRQTVSTSHHMDNWNTLIYFPSAQVMRRLRGGLIFSSQVTTVS